MTIDFRVDRLDSPIQAMLAEALVVELAFYTTRPEHVALRTEEPLPLRSRNIRADFVVILQVDGRAARLIVEADGAEYHDAEKDAERDREAAECGWSTIRFTGSAIFASPHACAAEVVRELAWLSRDRSSLTMGPVTASVT